MTNAMKYKSAKERAKAFNAFCDSHSSKCEGCPLYKACDDDSYAFAWLELEAEEERPLPCPFCGEPVIIKHSYTGKGIYRTYTHHAHCEICGYNSGCIADEIKAIAAHNRVARAVMEANEKEAK